MINQKKNWAKPIGKLLLDKVLVNKGPTKKNNIHLINKGPTLSNLHGPKYMNNTTTQDINLLLINC